MDTYNDYDVYRQNQIVIKILCYMSATKISVVYRELHKINYYNIYFNIIIKK